MTFYERLEIGLQGVPEGAYVVLGLIAVLCFFKALAGPVPNHAKPMEHKVVDRLIEHDGFRGGPASDSPFNDMQDYEVSNPQLLIDQQHILLGYEDDQMH